VVTRALEEAGPAEPERVAAVLADTLTARGVFCDLLAQAPLNLERNVSVERVRAFKLLTRGHLAALVAALRTALPGLSEQQAVDVVSTTTGLAGAFWQIATPTGPVAELYRSDPRLGHALIDVGPRLTRILAAELTGFLAG
jgi:hypothetical protein